MNGARSLIALGREAGLRLVAVTLMICCSAPAFAGADRPPQVDVRASGEAITVFRYTADACDAEDVPDAHARAFREADGTVTVIATHFRNRRLRGVDLLSARPDCAVVFEGADDPRPERRNGLLWIAATWTADGTTIHALVHGEYRGTRYPGRCPSGRFMECWYNTVTQAVSRDGGRTFRYEGDPPPLVAAVPYRYDPDAGRHVGFFGPTSIVRHRGAWYAMVFTEGIGLQARGHCLMRTENLADAAAWRAWGGAAFDVAFADPYAVDVRPERHVCAPVGRNALNTPVGSLSRHAPSGAFIATMATVRTDLATGAQRRAIEASASWDLLRWSAPVAVAETASPAPPDCAGEGPSTYPSLLDPDSTDRNFETVGDTAMLFMTRFNLKACRRVMDRDLVRLPVAISVRTD